MIKTNALLRRDVGLFLRQARIDKSLTGYQLAKILKISQQQVSRYERGETGINVEVLNTLLGVLERNWLEFFFKVLVNHSNEIADIRIQNEFSIQSNHFSSTIMGNQKKDNFQLGMWLE
ncbi:helix-turn-helix domain-containing protein [Providencia hangzhouensis]|uniref:helix-turn-helix domain-containing protein n=1 Tax=Providencia hangzhouensis TaxID=3031799 RepID=UPI0034DDA711